MKIAGPLHPPFSLFLIRRKRENGPCTVQKRKRRFQTGDGGRAWGLAFGYACLCPQLGAGWGFGGRRIGFLLFPLPLPWRVQLGALPGGSHFGGSFPGGSRRGGNLPPVPWARPSPDRPSRRRRTLHLSCQKESDMSYDSSSRRGPRQAGSSVTPNR